MQTNALRIVTRDTVDDLELKSMINVLCHIWDSGDRRVIDWAKVEFERSFYSYLRPKKNRPAKKQK